MKIGIMQPYFFPYIGYWQLICSVDQFVIYDNIKFTKNSWIRRNRILLDNKDKMITLPIKKDSDYLDIRERKLSENYQIERIKILNQIRMAYNKAPYFDVIFPLIKNCLLRESNNLFEFIHYTINKIIDFLNIDTKVVISSELKIDHNLKSKERVIEICHKLGSNKYINSIGGINLYDKEEFKNKEIELFFLKTRLIEYPQFNRNFVPNLSIIDVLMFNDKSKVKQMLFEYELI